MDGETHGSTISFCTDFFNGGTWFLLHNIKSLNFKIQSRKQLLKILSRQFLTLKCNILKQLVLLGDICLITLGNVLCIYTAFL